MKEQEYKENWINRKNAIAEMRSVFGPACVIQFRWVDTSGANWQGYSGYIVAEKEDGKTEYGDIKYKEINRIVSESPYLEDGTNLIGGKGCIAMCSFKKEDVEKFIIGLVA